MSIVIYPMLTSKSISQNAIPGICKILERYIIVYRTNSWLKISGVLGTLSFGRKLKSESVNLMEDDSDDDLFGDESGNKPKKSKNPSAPPDSKINKREAALTVKASGAKAEMAGTNNLALEPTYVQITNVIGGPFIVGAKVVPFPIDSEEGLAEMVMKERNIDLSSLIPLYLQRKAMKTFWATCKSLKIPFIRNRAVTGDPEQDILWGSSSHGKNIFMLLNYLDISDPHFFKSASSMKKLQSLGWNNLIVADDINKKVHFCMNEFNGMCSTISYPVLYASIGRDYLQVYENLDDVRKATSPFF